MARLTLDDDRDFLIWRQGSGTTVEIYDIVVGSERRRGRGRVLIEKLLNSLPEQAPGTTLVFAITRWSNTVACEFYEALGFRVVGRLHQFYHNDDGYEHAVMYGKDV